MSQTAAAAFRLPPFNRLGQFYHGRPDLSRIACQRAAACSIPVITAKEGLRQNSQIAHAPVNKLQGGAPTPRRRNRRKIAVWRRAGGDPPCNAIIALCAFCCSLPLRLCVLPLLQQLPVLRQLLLRKPKRAHSLFQIKA